MSQKVYLGTRKGLMTFEKTGDIWEVKKVDFLGHNVNMILEDARDDSLYACLNLGHFGTKMHRSSNGGETWEECAVPVFPDGAEVGAGPFVEAGMPATAPASLKEIWALEPGGTDQPQWLWAGTIPGGLFLSKDRGTHWELIESLWNRPERMEWFGGGKDEPGIHSICVDPRDSQHLTIAVSCGGVWETKDTGKTWELLGEGLRADFMPPNLANNKNSQDAHLMVQCKSDPDKMWIQHHNGIFHSSDGAKNWTEMQDVEPSSFGFAVCVHPEDGNQAWFVPGLKDECRVPVDGKLVVTKTSDGGKSFVALREGLPQQHCYDIVFRHAMDIDRTGKQIVFGSSTGGVWISENSGETWDSITQTLPQIYCVQFAK